MLKCTSVGNLLNCEKERLYNKKKWTLQVVNKDAALLGTEFLIYSVIKNVTTK